MLPSACCLLPSAFFWLLNSSSWILAFVLDPPNLLPAIIRNQNTAIRQLHDRHRPPPHLARFGRNHPARQKFLYRTARLAIFERNETHFVSHALRAIPGSMESQECAALICRWKLLARVKKEIEHRNM